jgi:hypothetical protein
MKGKKKADSMEMNGNLRRKIFGIGIHTYVKTEINREINVVISQEK